MENYFLFFGSNSLAQVAKASITQKERPNDGLTAMRDGDRAERKA